MEIALHRAVRGRSDAEAWSAQMNSFPAILFGKTSVPTQLL